MIGLNSELFPALVICCSPLLILILLKPRAACAAFLGGLVAFGAFWLIVAMTRDLATHDAGAALGLAFFGAAGIGIVSGLCIWLRMRIPRYD